ncbi:MAG: FAD-binding protein, partial [Alphaproteobacteria bacterium]|nr:FAD-binding protein [Alphaproteobacteria bacterium]
ATQIPPNPQLVTASGTLHQADTLAELAGLTNLSGTGLIETVAGYNSAVRAGRLAALIPAHSTRSGAPRAIETPPFFAIPICAGITNTMSGIAIDGHGRVRRPDGTTIDGLYVAGGATGGLEGGGTGVGYVGGLCHHRPPVKSCRS